jgi:allantoate deiminase
MTGLADKVIRTCYELAACSEEPRATTRTFLSAPMRDVHRILGDWMRSLNIRVWVDAAGNLRGIHGDPEARRLIIGSHLDTVPWAGAFDGILGVAMAIALVESGSRMAIEVIGFSEEEGVRFGMPFIGSRALAGTLDYATIQRRDANGISIEKALRGFGLDPNQLDDARVAQQALGYLEIHIEQGPVLEHANLPLGIVDVIAGQSRVNLTFEGAANHAGTTPMGLRRDALAAAAEWILAVEMHARAEPGLVATVGSLDVSPNAGNVIPGEVQARLDLRHPSNEVRHKSLNMLITAAASICRSRNIGLRHEELLDQPAVAMDASLRDRLALAVGEAGYPVHRMPSGAGHDAMILAPHVPSAMLFLRSPGGISHHPDESVLAADVEAGLQVGRRFIESLGEKLEPAHV